MSGVRWFHLWCVSLVVWQWWGFWRGWPEGFIRGDRVVASAVDDPAYNAIAKLDAAPVYLVKRLVFTMGLCFPSDSVIFSWTSKAFSDCQFIF